MEVTSLGWRTDVALLRLAGSSVEDRGDHVVVRSPYNPTFWWGNFVLVDHLPRPGEAESLIDVFHAEFPEAGHVAVGFDTEVGSRAALRGFALNGCEAQADAVMTADGLDPPRPADPDVVVRKLRYEDDWAQCLEQRVRINEPPVGRDAWRDYLQRRVEADRRMVAGGRGAWFGAFSDGRLVSQLGIVSAGAGLARYQSVGTDPDHRRQGLAGALLYHAGTWALDRLGAKTLVIVADPDYVAIALYRKLGFRTVHTQLRAQRPAPTG